MADAEVFLERTNQLAFVRDFLKDAPYPSTIALLSVHSAIALNDAVLTVLTGNPHKGQGHKEAAGQTKVACRQENVNAGGVKHLDTLIRLKTDISYGDRHTTSEQAERLRSEAERFETWAFKLLRSRGIVVREA